MLIRIALFDGKLNRWVYLIILWYFCLLFHTLISFLSILCHISKGKLLLLRGHFFRNPGFCFYLLYFFFLHIVIDMLWHKFIANSIKISILFCRLVASFSFTVIISIIQFIIHLIAVICTIAAFLSVEFLFFLDNSK